MWSKPGCLCLICPFSQSQNLWGFFSISPPVLHAFFSNFLSILHKRRIKAQQQGVESWNVSPGTDICASYFSASYFTSNQRALLCFFVVVYLLPTMAMGGQLKCRTALSCLRFSIHAGKSTHSYSMSVSLRLAKRSGSTSIRHHLSFRWGRFFLFLFLFIFYKSMRGILTRKHEKKIEHYEHYT